MLNWNDQLQKAFQYNAARSYSENLYSKYLDTVEEIYILKRFAHFTREYWRFYVVQVSPKLPSCEQSLLRSS